MYSLGNLYVYSLAALRLLFSERKENAIVSILMILQIGFNVTISASRPNKNNSGYLEVRDCNGFDRYAA